ncbi:diguanylate cyclase [Marinobacter sp. HL-58]|uniref:diguanylate cyclase n=1 Tax=Marinobacter sp. HL-58 TaxID=1479237 RepID=UPI0006920CDD|nr:diguanylate cyclase [Marinobacter sp. HL-58]KPP96908.1 MAG: diguanylate cyclase (GGDEF) domain [Marinobacter sp. HL-58]
MLKAVVSTIRVMVLLVLWSGVSAVSQASDAVVGAEARQDLTGSVSIYRNDKSDLSLDRAAELFRQGEFTRPDASEQSPTNFGLTQDEVWLAFELSTPEQVPERIFLEVGHASLDDVNFYLLENDELVAHQRSGDTLPFSEKPVSHRNHVFPLSLSAASQYQIFVSVRSEGTLTVPVTLWQGDSLWRSDQYAYATLGLYYGLLIALLIYNLFLFFSLRDVLYLTYVGFIACLAIGQAGLSGLTGHFLWPDSPWLVHLSPTAGVAAAGVFGALFVQRFLAGTPARLKLGWLMPCISVAYGLTFLTAAAGFYAMAAVAVNLLSMVFAVAALMMGAVSLWRKEPGARFFVLAWVSFLLGVLVIALHNVGVLPSNGFTTNALMIGSAMEMLLLSLALADRTRELETTNRQLWANQQVLERQANHDALTGLANRKLLQDRLTGAKARARRSGESFALVVVDLDKFKEINDTHGHSAGDEVLVSVSNKLKALTRSSDTVARIGGDEFVLLLEGLKKGGDLSRLKNNLSLIGDMPIVLEDGPEVRVGLSIGVAMYPDDTSNIDNLFSQADADMYRDKQERVAATSES